MRTNTEQTGGIGADPEIERMIGTTAEEVATESIEAGEMIPATGPEDGETILLT